MIWLIGLGGVLGTLARYYLGRWVNARAASPFPWGTWLINGSGSLLLGVLFSLHLQQRLPEEAWLILGTGFCGAYTTFSTFGFEAVQLFLGGARIRAAVYVISSLVLGLVSALLGMLLPLAG